MDTVDSIDAIESFKDSIKRSKIQDYESILDSIMKNLSDYTPKSHALYRVLIDAEFEQCDISSIQQELPFKIREQINEEFKDELFNYELERLPEWSASSYITSHKKELEKIYKFNRARLCHREMTDSERSDECSENECSDDQKDECNE